MNVLPFVRRYTEAKPLWDALVGLYGEGNGIAMAGGPVLNGKGLMEGRGDKRQDVGAREGGANESSTIAMEKGKRREVAGIHERTKMDAGGEGKDLAKTV